MGCCSRIEVPTEPVNLSMNMQSLSGASGGGGMGWLSIAPLLFIFAIFYFLLILPQQRRQKKWTAMLDALKTGDKVVTSGGLRGTIMALKDDSVHLRVPPNNLVLEVTRASVTQVTTSGGRSVRPSSGGINHLTIWILFSL